MADTTVTLTMSDLINEALDFLQSANEVPRPVVLNGTISAAATTLNLDTASEGSVSASHLLEFGQELIYVTEADRTSSPHTFTVVRGFAGTTAAGHTDQDAGTLNPRYPRHQAQRQVERAFSKFNRWVPRYVAQRLTADGSMNIDLDADVMDVLSIRYLNTSTAKLTPISLWSFHDRLDTAVSTNGKMVVLPQVNFANGTLLEAVVQKPWAWSATPPVEASTIDFVTGGEDLAPLYAAGMLATGHEVSRLELTSMEEWSQEAAIRQGVNIRLVRELWNQFYLRLEDVQAIQNRPRRLVYRRRDH